MHQILWLSHTLTDLQTVPHEDRLVPELTVSHAQTYLQVLELMRKT